LKTKAIAEAKIKTDTLDARTLAHLLRSDLVAECYIAPREIREDRLLLRLRINLVQDRTRVMNRDFQFSLFGLPLLLQSLVLLDIPQYIYHIHNVAYSLNDSLSFTNVIIYEER
jgi:hypothetical protein